MLEVLKRARPTLQSDACSVCGGTVEAGTCTACGRRSAAAITFASLLRDGVSAAVGVNSRWLRTSRDLLVRAGSTAAEYVRGVRDRYSHPVAYALASITAYVIARQLTEPADSFVGLFDPVLRLGAGWPYLSIPLLAPSAFVLRSLFRKARCTAAEAYVLILYVAAQIALVETGWVAALHFGAPSWLAYGVRALEAVYATGAIVQFTGERSWHGWARAALVLGTAVGTFYGFMWLLVWYVVRGLFG